LDEFRDDLNACADCRASLEVGQAQSYLPLRLRPLYQAPAALRSACLWPLLQ
jgi:hypothetical protein